MPARKILRSYRTVTGLRPNILTDETNQFESMLERDFLLLLSFSSSVKHYETQPVTIDYKLNGEDRSYTPDVLITYHSTKSNPTTTPPTELVEVKYTKDLVIQAAELAPKFSAAENYCASRNWVFNIVTEKEIRTDYLQNIKFLLRYRSYPENEFVQARILSALRELRESTPAELLVASCGSESEKGIALTQIWRLISIRVIETDLSNKIGMKSSIWLTGL